MADLVIDGQTIEAIVMPNGEELELGGGEPTLQSKTLNVSSAGTTTVTPDSGYDGLDEVEVNVPQALGRTGIGSVYVTQSGLRKWLCNPYFTIESGGYLGAGEIEWSEFYNAVPANTTVTPTESAQTIGGADTMMEAAVTVAAIPSNYVGSGITRRSSTDLTASGATVSVPSGYYASNASKAVASGTEGTPTATKGTVSNHAVSVTPSVTNSAGYISGGTHTGTAVSVSASELVSGTVNITSSGNTDVTNYATASVASGSATASATKGTVTNHSVTVTPSVTRTAGYVTAGTASGTAVTVSASELVSGNLAITENGTDIDVSNYSTVSVAVEGGGGGGVQIGKTTKTTASAASSIQFTGLSGNPTSFAITSADDVATNTNGVTEVVFDGTSLHGQTMTTGVTADTGFTKSYSGGTLTVTVTTASFLAGDYKLVYTYGGSASDIETEDIQVGSGATSITFPVSGRPAYWSCIFKSDFTTSSGYQRVIGVVNDGSSIYGLAMDSSAHAATSWTATYSGGNLTITSSGTNQGGYFHQPGYYQLTYYVDASAPSYQTKSAYATTTAQTITPDSGYDALESVSIGAISQTNLIAGNIKSGTTVSISNGSTNLWSVVGTYTGGGGGTLTVATKTITQTSTTQTLSFTSLSGQPKYWFLRATTNVSSSGSTTYYYVTDCFYDGTNIKGNTFRIGSTRRVQNITSGISQSYSSGTLTITAGSASTTTPGQFYGASSFGYELVYIY